MGLGSRAHREIESPLFNALMLLQDEDVQLTNCILSQNPPAETLSNHASVNVKQVSGAFALTTKSPFV